MNSDSVFPALLWVPPGCLIGNPNIKCQPGKYNCAECDNDSNKCTKCLDGFHMNEFGFCIPGVLNKRPNIKCQPGKYNCAGFHMNEFGFCIPGTLMGTPNIKCQHQMLKWIPYE
eukprot:TRINITY_DN1815_c0_g1_i9.p5 TRINITY_DN1815_c0_g1~~TRINITY_DN1815_c0_g1_i9.p5  ORF type:complete len:114 (-),score=6.64 TRINITY_DN1815_c0_g1_i9:115-456(-)